MEEFAKKLSELLVEYKANLYCPKTGTFTLVGTINEAVVVLEVRGTEVFVNGAK